jgi:hypothetical protein
LRLRLLELRAILILLDREKQGAFFDLGAVHEVNLLQVSLDAATNWTELNAAVLPVRSR